MADGAGIGHLSYRVAQQGVAGIAKGSSEGQCVATVQGDGVSTCNDQSNVSFFVSRPLGICPGRHSAVASLLCMPLLSHVHPVESAANDELPFKDFISCRLLMQTMQNLDRPLPSSLCPACMHACMCRPDPNAAWIA